MLGFFKRYTLASLVAALGLGVGARVVMRFIALGSGQPGGFSLGGYFEVVLFGALVGLPVALGFFAIRYRITVRMPVVGAVFALLVFAIFALRPPEAARGALAGTPDPPGLALLLFGGLFLLFGTALEWAWRKLRPRVVQPHDPGRI